VDVVISNYLINLSAESRPCWRRCSGADADGWIVISDVIAEDQVSPADRAAAGSWGCVAAAPVPLGLRGRLGGGRVHGHVGHLHR
jgi:hypothetical protein